MFRKPFKIKSNTQIKGSDRKTVKEQILMSFPSITAQDLENFMPKKEILHSIKIVTASDETVQVLTLQKRPMMFEIRGRLYPTVYLLWKHPNILQAFTTHTAVWQYLSSGADLMLPGVVTPPGVAAKYSHLPNNAAAYVNFVSNKAAVAVGVTAQSSADMMAAHGRGKCLIVYHLHGDKLCSLEGMNVLPVPDMGPPDWLSFTNYDQDFPVLGGDGQGAAAPPLDPVPDLLDEACDDAELDKEDSPQQMDELLNYCFMVAIKYSKTLTLPILTSNFYKLQMIAACPDGKTLDIKKSTFKKLKPFLDSMCQDGIIAIKEVKKGVESINAINKNHPKYSEFYVAPEDRPRKAEDEGACASTSITESYVITQNVLPIFAAAGLNKGDTVPMTAIRRHVTDFVKNNDCQDQTDKRFVQPKDVLVNICKTENNVTWEELLEKVCESMKSCFKVSSGADEILSKGKVPPITMTVSMRSGNKKVTLIDNLELFGIRIADFAKECQHGVAASTSISRPPGKKSDQLLVQGNQVLFVYNLLTDKYKIPQKYIRGLENAPKKKK